MFCDTSNQTQNKRSNGPVIWDVLCKTICSQPNQQLIYQVPVKKILDGSLTMWH